MRKFLATLLALVMTLALMVPASWGENKETYQLPDSLAGKTVILHTNDVHGAIDKYAKVAALRDECYDKGAHQVILLDAGDYSQGSPYVSLSKGATALDLMALVGYDVITLGNHEFDYGFPHQTRKIRTCFRLEKGSDFSFSSGLRMKAPVDGVKLRYLVIDRKPITRFGGCDYEVRCKSLPFQHGHWMCGAAAPGWEKNLHRLYRGRGCAGCDHGPAD